MTNGWHPEKKSASFRQPKSSKGQTKRRLPIPAKSGKRSRRAAIDVADDRMPDERNESPKMIRA